MSENTKQNSENISQGGSVTDLVVKNFINAVSAEAELVEIGSRLQKVLIDEDNDSESALRSAILGHIEP